MSELSPYQSPQSQPQPPYPGYPPLNVPPGSVKTFGIMHIIFAVFGILGAIWSVAQVLLFDTLMKAAGTSGDELAMQQMIHDKTAWLTWVSVPLTLIVAAIMLPAGIKLVKGRRDGLAWSNRYAWASIGSKVIQLGLSCAVVLPAMMSAMRQMMPKGSSMGGMETAIMGGAIGGVILGLVVSFVYPVLTLVVLNRKPVKEWFETRP